MSQLSPAVHGPAARGPAARGFLRLLASQAWTVLRKDMLLEWRGRSRIIAVFFFGLVTLTLFAFGGDADTVQLREGAAGYLIVALLLSSTLSLSESFRLENEQDGVEGLLLLPIDTTALYYGKAVGNTLFLLFLSPFLTVIALVLYKVEFNVEQVVQILGIWALTAAGLTAPGTLYSAMTSRLRSQDVLLPILLFPLVAPVVLAAVRAMDLVLAGDAMNQMGDLVVLLVIFDIIYWALCGVLFHHVIEEP